MKRSVTVRVGELARQALNGETGSGVGHLGPRAERAVRAYLGDRGAGRIGWKVPTFARSEEASEWAELQLSLDEDLLTAVEAEAVAQGVSVDRLVGHAILYWAAEVDAGRITERIIKGLDDLGDKE